MTMGRPALRSHGACTLAFVLALGSLPLSAGAREQGTGTGTGTGKRPPNSSAKGMINKLGGFFLRANSAIERAVKYRDINRLWRSPKSSSKVTAEIYDAVSRAYYLRGLELTEEGKAGLLAMLDAPPVTDSGIFQTDKKTYDVSATVAIAGAHPLSQAIPVKDAAHDVSFFRIYISDGFPVAPVRWERGERGTLGTTLDFWRDLRTPEDAAGRELKSLYGRVLSGFKFTTRVTLPFLTLSKIGTAVATASVDPLISMIYWDSSIAAIALGVPYALTFNRYANRVSEIKHRDPAYLPLKLRRDIGKVTGKGALGLGQVLAKEKWSPQDVDTAADMLNQAISRSVMETSGHLQRTHVHKAKGKGKPAGIEVIAILDSDENAIEAYPLTFELSLGDVRKHQSAPTGN